MFRRRITGGAGSRWSRLWALWTGATCGVVVTLVGVGVLVGWLIDSVALKTFWLGDEQMKANAAVAFVLAGLGLLAVIADRSRALRLLGGTVALIGLLTLAEYVFGADLGIDGLLFDEPAPAAQRAPNRMGVNTALCFTLAGASLLSLDVERRGMRPAQAGALAIGIVATVALLGYLFGVPRLETGGFVSVQVTPMAAATALTFVLLAAGLVLTRPAVGVIGLARSPGAGGALVRRLLAPAIALPVAFGYLLLEGERAGLYGTAEGVALFATSVAVVFTALLWLTARALERLDIERGEGAARERAVLEAGLDAFMTIDATGRIVEFSPVAEELFGYPREQAIGAELAQLIIAPSVRERHRRGLARRAAHSAANGKVRLESVAQRADGSEFPVEVAVSALDGPGAAAFAGNVRDISERQRLEQQLRQSQKMEAIGQLAGGVAHDFNNLLTVIGGYGAMARERIGAGPGGEELGEIERACHRATQLTRQLLAFSHQQVLNPTALDLNEVIRSLTPMLRRLIREDIEIAALAEPGLDQVLADRGQLEQVIVNLALNARDAMPTGGTLTFQTETVVLDATDARAHLSAKPGRYVCLIVTDTGVGMDADTVARIFEPFFTTKPVGLGTGLGLATVHGIVTQSRGHVEVYSEPGLGTSFKIHLPYTEPTATSPKTAAHDDERDRQRGTETILVCEDEDSVRRLIEDILTAHGYTALIAARPSDALRIADTHAGPIAALVSDVVMPEMPGPELAQRLQAIRPGLRTIFVSGYAAHTIRERGTLPSGSTFLEKPFTRATLLSAVRDLIDQPHASTEHQSAHNGDATP